MSQTFNDGDPIDASTLQNLKTEVARALALSGVTTSGSTITLEGRSLNPGDIVAKKFYAGLANDGKSLSLPAASTSNKNAVEFNIDYSDANFTKKPFIALTVASESNKTQFYPPVIVRGSVGISSAKGQIQNNGPARSLIIHFIAIQM